MLTITKKGLKTKDDAFAFAEDLFASLDGGVKITVKYEVYYGKFDEGRWTVTGEIHSRGKDYEITVF